MILFQNYIAKRKVFTAFVHPGKIKQNKTKQTEFFICCKLVTVGGYEIFFKGRYKETYSWWNSKTALFLRLFQSFTDLAVMEWVS